MGYILVFIFVMLIHSAKSSFFSSLRMILHSFLHGITDKVLIKVPLSASLTLESVPVGGDCTVRSVGFGEQRCDVCVSVGETAHVAHRPPLTLPHRREHCLLSLTLDW